VNALPIAEAGSNQSICSGTSASLTATGGGTYQWDTGSSNVNISVSPSTQTTYTVTVTNNGCSASDNVVVFVNALPIAEAGSNQSICSGSSASLTATGGGTYLWSTGSTNANISVTPDTQTTYTVTVTNNTCTASDNVVVSINNNITPTITALPSHLCAGQSTLLTANGGTIFNWNTGENTADITVAPSINTTYTVTVSTTTGCSGTTDVAISVQAQLTIITNPAVICSGESTTLTASGGIDYKWDNGSLTQSITVSPTTTTTYAITVTDHACSATSSAVVTVKSLPIAEAGSSQTICAGNSANLSASGGGTYLWSTTETNSTINVSPSVPSTTYNLTVTNNGCSASDNVIVNVTPLPIADAGLPKTICIGDNIALTATGGASYLWNTGSANSTINVTPTVTSTYVVTVTSNACTASDNVVVTVASNPIADAGAPQAICEGSSINLIATGGADFKWSNGVLVANNNVSPTNTTTYTVTVSNGTCSSTDDVVVTVNTLPIAEAGLNQTICNGSSASLTASGGGTYQWNTGEAVANITVSPIITSTYTVTVTSNACTASDNVVVTVNPLPIATIATPVAICSGNNTDITASGGGTYLWNTGQITATINVAPTTTNTYTVTVSKDGCTSSTNVVVTVNPLPIASATANPTIICKGTTTFLNSNGGNAYSWVSSPIGFTSTSQNPSVTPDVTTTYTVLVTDANLCSDTESIIITVNQNPIATVSASPMVICEGSSSTLNSGGGTTFSWTSNPIGFTSTLQSPVVSPITTTTYSVVVSNAVGCSDTEQVEVKVNSYPIASASVAQSTICKGSSTTLNASGGTVYSWTSTPSGFTSSSSSPTISPTITTTYTVTVNNGTLCESTAQTIVNVDYKPQLTLQPSNIIDICSGADTTLSVSGGNSYIWSTGETTSSISISPTTNITYTLTATSGVCFNDTLFIVNVLVLSQVEIGNNITVCNGEQVTFSALSNTNQLVWSNGSTSSSISVSDSGIYSIIASNLCGIAYDTVKLLNHPTPTLNLGSDTTLCINNFQIVAPANFDKYYWSTGEIASSIVANTGGVYYVEAIDVNGCKASDSIKLTDSCYTDMFIPNAFTPNNDNFNEIFKAIGTNIVEFEIFIFNRWGEQLYHSEDILEGWNGTFKGRTCPQGVYYYLITYRGLRDVKKSAKGHLTLVR
ncbi:MAG: gliding motility-associated C-terminal domain-containing protein, partial [Bacteroidota bacterium]